MDASQPEPTPVPDPLDAEATRWRQELEDIHEELLLAVLALEDEWFLDDRIAYALRQQDAA